jgi:hypothetical protein
VNFKKIPVLLETSKASYYVVYNDCTFKFLRQASVPVKRMKLADIVIYRNSHIHFIEKNSDQIAGVLVG